MLQLDQEVDKNMPGDQTSLAPASRRDRANSRKASRVRVDRLELADLRRLQAGPLAAIAGD